MSYIETNQMLCKCHAKNYTCQVQIYTFRQTVFGEDFEGAVYPSFKMKATGLVVATINYCEVSQQDPDSFDKSKRPYKTHDAH